MSSPAAVPVPYRSSPFPVLKEWTDYNGHLNMGYYPVVMDTGTEPAYDAIGIGAHYITHRGNTFMTVEAHICYLREVLFAKPVEVQFRVLEVDTKRAHFWTEVHQTEEGYLAATMETMVLNVGVESRKTEPWPDDIREVLDAWCAAQSALPRPERAGRRIITLKKP